MIIEKGVAKNVSAAATSGVRAGSVPMLRSHRPTRAGSLARRMLVAAVIVGAALPGLSPARSAPGLGGDVAVTRLPPPARQTLQLIHSGGPFPYAKDGVVFGNYEKRLERRPRGYYHEYTVPTPGAHDRGARRIICGGRATEPDACFYTEDHYNSFHRIVG